MKLLLEFSEKDFENLRKFGAAVEKQIGSVYVGTDNLCAYFDYPPELAALLRPVAGNSYPPEKLQIILNKLKNGTITFELNSAKPQ